MKKKLTSKMTKQEFDQLLLEIETELIKAVPEAVRKEKIKTPAYGILLCYIDFTTDTYSPFAVVLSDTHRQECIANRSVESLWTICEVTGRQCDIAPKSSVHRNCLAVYRYLQDRWGNQDELKVLKPFREMIYRVCLTLNEFDWAKTLPVTEDFVVIASDWSTGTEITRDAKASVPLAKQKTLASKGLFFNPSKLPKPKLPTGGILKSIAKKSPDEQIAFWIAELDAQFEPRECESALQGIGPKQIAKKLAKLGPPAIESLFDFVVTKAELPEWLTATAEPQFTIDSARTKMFEILFESLKDGLKRTKENESRLWQMFDIAVETNRTSQHWGALPGIIAFGIQEMYDKYTYWVTRGFENNIQSMDEILEQRNKLAPKEARTI